MNITRSSWTWWEGSERPSITTPTDREQLFLTKEASPLKAQLSSLRRIRCPRWRLIHTLTSCIDLRYPLIMRQWLHQFLSTRPSCKFKTGICQWTLPSRPSRGESRRRRLDDQPAVLLMKRPLKTVRLPDHLNSTTSSNSRCLTSRMKRSGTWPLNWMPKRDVLP